jgi:hypothetical protein
VRKIFLVECLGASILVMMACKASVTVENESPLGKTKVTFDVDPGEGTAELPADPPETPPGFCVKVTFLDGSGNPMGSLETTAGSGPFPFPEGAEGAEVGPCDEEDKDPKDKAKRGRGGATDLSGSRARRYYAFQYLPLDLLDGEATVVSYAVLASSLSEARLTSRQFTRHLFTAPAPKWLDTRVAYESILQPDGGVQMTFLSEAAPQSFEVRWNGQFIADLSGAVVEARDGWFRTMVIVPPSVVEESTTETSSNALVYSLIADGIDVGGSSSVVVDPL